MANLAIHTAQNVNLNYKIVNVGERILAFFIDLFLFFLYFYVIEIITDLLGAAFSDRWTVFGLQQFLLLPVMFYSLYMHILFNGQTVGKMILKTRVVKMDGSRCTGPITLPYGCCGLSIYGCSWGLLGC